MTHTIEQGIAPGAPSIGTGPELPPPSSRSTVLGWAAVGMGLVAAVVVVLLTITSDPSPHTSIYRAPTELSVGSPPVGAPGSADGAERYLANLERLSRRVGAPGSADGAERYLANLERLSRRVGAPGSADGAERYLANLERLSRRVGAPGSADGAERYLAHHR